MTTVASTLERYMLGLINADRAALGLSPLTLELNLNSSAQAHSDWMVAADTFSHTGVGGSSSTERMLAADMDLSGNWRTAENIGAVTVSGAGDLRDEVDRLHDNLMNSPGHYANLMDPGLTVIGIGLTVGPLTYGGSGSFSSVLVTQNFATTGGLVDLDLSGGGGADLLAGLAGDDVISGGEGADTLVTGDGDDTVDGQGGDDLIRVGTGVKQIAGGDGEDTVELALDRAAVTVAGTPDAPELSAPGLSLSLTGIETIRFADGAVAVADLFAPPTDPGAITGTAGADLVKGTGVAETLSGLAGDDALLAEGRGLYGTEVSAQVYRLYAAVLGREPEVAGHQAWTGMLAGGARTLEGVAAGFMGSPEFRATYADTTDAEFVTLLYNNVLGRDPNATGLASWVENLEGGMARERVVVLFSQSAEHKTLRAPAQTAFDTAHDPTSWADDVYRLYQGLLDREPDATGLAAWVQALADGRALPSVVGQFMASPEFQTRYGATTDAEFVTLLYNNVLDREPDAGGFATWTDRLANGMSREALVERFVQSPEFTAATAPGLHAWMTAQGPDDVLIPGSGDDLLSGGLWSDSFVFDPAGGGTKTVSDLEPWDLVDLTGFGYADVAEAMTHVSTVDGDAIFEDGGLRVVFLDADLDAGMVLV